MVVCKVNDRQLEFYQGEFLCASLIHECTEVWFKTTSMNVICSDRIYDIIEELLIYIDASYSIIEQISIPKKYSEYHDILVSLGFIIKRDYVFYRRSIISLPRK